MIYCDKCGNELTSNDKFCFKCGNSLEKTKKTKISKKIVGIFCILIYPFIPIVNLYFYNIYMILIEYIPEYFDENLKFIITYIIYLLIIFLLYCIFRKSHKKLDLKIEKRINNNELIIKKKSNFKKIYTVIFCGFLIIISAVMIIGIINSFLSNESYIVSIDGATADFSSFVLVNQIILLFIFALLFFVSLSILLKQFNKTKEEDKSNDIEESEKELNDNLIESEYETKLLNYDELVNKKFKK